MVGGWGCRGWLEDKPGSIAEWAEVGLSVNSRFSKPRPILPNGPRRAFRSIVSCLRTWLGSDVSRYHCLLGVVWPTFVRVADRLVRLSWAVGGLEDTATFRRAVGGLVPPTTRGIRVQRWLRAPTHLFVSVLWSPTQIEGFLHDWCAVHWGVMFVLSARC